MALRVFPVWETSRYSDDYGKPRSGGRTHQGTDIFASEGTPIHAVDRGRLRFDSNKLGGTVAYLHANDGTDYYFAHLLRTEGQARQVEAGDVLGYVGRTGNASHTDPHLHFEIHPAGGKETIDPFPALRAVQTPAALPVPSPGPESPKEPLEAPSAAANAGGWLLLLLMLRRSKR